MQQVWLSRGKNVIAVIVAVVLAASIALPNVAVADTSDEVYAEAEAVLESIESMEEELGEYENEYYEALQEQEEAEAARDEAEAAIEELSEELEDLQDRLAERVRSMYRSGSYSFLDLLLGSTTFEAFVSNWDLLNDINEEDAELVEETEAARAELEEQEAIYEEEAAAAEAAAEEALAVYEDAQDTIEELQATYENLSDEAAELLAEEEAAEQAAIEAALAEAEAEQAALEEAAAAEEAEEEAETEAAAEEEETVVEEEEEEAEEESSSTSSSSSESSSSSSSSSSSDDDDDDVAYNSSLASAIVSRAYSCIGLSYEWGAVGPDTFDCSGLVSYCLTGSYTRLGTAATFYSTYTRVSDPQPGDICCTSTHCGIYIGNGLMIHAPGTGKTVCISSVYSGMIYVRYGA